MTPDSIHRRATLAKTLPKDKRGRHLLTVAVEDFFHATALNPLVPDHHWEHFESRVAQNTDRALKLIEQNDCRATFFVLGWVADHMPHIVEEILARGHEVASKGYDHRPISSFSQEGFRAETRRAKHAIERVLGHRVLGFRIPEGSFGLDDLWALRVLAEEGHLYDSSIYPRLRSIASEPWRRFPHLHEDGASEILEFPLSTWGPDGFLVPVAGGNYVRQLPPPLMRKSFEFWTWRYTSPFNMYFHVWELDPDLPRISTAGLATRIRQYRNLTRMPELLSQYLHRYEFVSIAEYLGIEQTALTREVPVHLDTVRELSIEPTTPGPPVTIVVPCYNEALVLPFLANTLRELDEGLGRTYDLNYIFVDDASSDDTWAVLQDRFGDREDCRLLRHEDNQGVAAAILTGIRAANTEVVCSIDCDCTYDPRQLADLIPLLRGDVAMVTASPYHRDGRAVGVPGWRLLLSKNLSRLYGTVLRHQFATYTSCFRVYRRAAVENLELEHSGFLGVAEILVQLDLAGAEIVECPAVLEARLLGTSKMKTLHTIRGHLKLLSQIPIRRLRGSDGA